MRAALIVNQVGPDHQKNLIGILNMAGEAASAGAELILLPEAALTGLINDDNPVHDLPLGELIPSPVTEVIGALCIKHSVWLGIGLLEREGNSLYDTALLFDDNGRIRLKYRRIQPQWHGKNAELSVYRQGTELSKVSTPFGSLAFLICGDLFDDEIVSTVRELQPDWVLIPFARCFPDGAANQHRWDNGELPGYVERVKLTGAPALMVNYLADNNLNDGNTFGGAYAITSSGKVIASYPLGIPGILFVELNELLDT